MTPRVHHSWRLETFHFQKTIFWLATLRSRLLVHGSAVRGLRLIDTPHRGGRHSSVGRLIRGSLTCDYSGTCVGALRDRPHDTLPGHQAQAVVEETTHHARANPQVRPGAGCEGWRALEQQSGDVTGSRWWQ